MSDIQNALIAAVVFALVSSPFMYGVTDNLLGSIVRTIDDNKVVTTAGLVLHAVVFAVIAYVLMQVGPK